MISSDSLDEAIILFEDLTQYILMLREQNNRFQIYQKYKNKNKKWKTTIIGKEAFQIYEQYQITEVIGYGEMGIVVAAKDKEAKEKENFIVAIKKYKEIFDHKIFVKKALRQLRMLRLLKHQNILNIKTIILPKSRSEFQDLYVVFELIDTDFSQIIRSGQILTQEHNKFFLYQILRGLKYIHSAQITHRGISPKNLLINQNCDLKIKKFRLSFFKFRQQRARQLTQQTPNRWYSSPQVLLNTNHNHQNSSVDIWSVGCVFAEMLLMRPFLTGTDSRNQIQLLCQYFSQGIANMKHISNHTRKIIKQILDDKPKLKDIRKMFSFADPKAIDLLEKMLTVDLDKRITAVEALRHPYLQQLHLQEDEPTAEQVNCLEFQFENHNLTNEQLKNLLYEQILLYNFQDFKAQYENKKTNNQSLIKHILQNDKEIF